MTAFTADLIKICAIHRGMEYLSCLSPQGFHRVAYRAYGAPSAQRTVLCLHGLTRNSGDFIPIATALAAQGWYVLCPDMIGRGASDYADPMLYAYPQYLADVTALIARSGAAKVHLLGTSMGGIIGMLLASQANTPLASLIINDVGPYLAAPALMRIAAYVGVPHHFNSRAEAVAMVAQIYSGFGPLTPDEWQALTATSIVPDKQGGWRFAFDPKIALNFANLATDVNLWSVYEQIKLPTMLIHGAQSDLLSAEVAQQMTERGPKAELLTITDSGHAPLLHRPFEIQAIAAFLNRSAA